MYAPGTPQHTVCDTLSQIPDGFNLNNRHNYVPFCIPTTNSHGEAPAKYVRVHMGANPTVMGCMYKGGVVHQGEVQAAPNHNHGHTPDYTHEQLQHFHSDYQHCHKVDDTLKCISNKC
jgi:hypothetical protein